MRIAGVIGSLATTVALLVAAPPASGAAWPGGNDVAVADAADALGGDVSGLAYQGSGSSAPGVMWAVDNGDSKLQRLIFDGTLWSPDPANGWANGKMLSFPSGGATRPDAEGVTLVDGDPNAVYVSSESDLSVNASRLSVLRYDVTAAGATLDATAEWDLTADLPSVGVNAGLEAVTWIPDSVLVAKGFRDEARAAAYDPATYPNHGTGLFFVGVEGTGTIHAYALTQGGTSFSRVASFASGFPGVVELTFEPQTRLLWAVCDNLCGGQWSTFDVGSGGAFAAVSTYDRPSGLGDFNLEGFAIAPEAECVNGRKPVFWADDDNNENHVLRAGTLDCVVSPPATPPDTKLDGSASAKQTQAQKGRKIVVTVTVQAGETLTAEAVGKVKVGKDSYLLKRRTTTVAAAGSLPLKLKPTRKDAGEIADALTDGGKARAKVTVELEDAVGNLASETLKVKLGR